MGSIHQLLFLKINKLKKTVKMSENQHGTKLASVINIMTLKKLLKYGLLAVMSAALVTTVEAGPDKKPKKEKPNKERPERDGKKFDPAKVKERLKAAFEKRRKNHGEAKKKGNKIRQGRTFGKLVRDDAKIKELREGFKKAMDGMKGEFDKSKFKDATDEEKTALREQMTASRKEWMEQVKSHRKEVHTRIKEIREEFKNKRDEVIDGNEPGE